jgi:hypothetical protein
MATDDNKAIAQEVVNKLGGYYGKPASALDIANAKVDTTGWAGHPEEKLASLEPEPGIAPLDQFSDGLPSGGVSFGAPEEELEEGFTPDVPIEMAPVFNQETGKWEDKSVGWKGVPLPKPNDQAPEIVQTSKEQTAMGLQESVIQRRFEIEKDEADLNAYETEKLMEQNAKIDADNADKLQADRDNVEQAYEQFETANKDLVDLKVDKDQYWNSKSTGQKIAGALSLMLSSYQMGKAGNFGKNPMIAMYEKAVNDDIRIQLAEHTDKRAGVSRKKNLVNFYRDRLGNDEQAVAAVKLKANQDAVARVTLFKAKNEGTRAGIRADSALADLAVARAQHEAAFARAAEQNFYKKARHDRSERALNTNIKQSGQGTEYLKADTAREARHVKELVSQQGAATDAVNSIRELQDKYGAFDWANPSSELKAEMSAARSALRSAFKIMLVGTGTISDVDQKIIRDALPELGGAFGSVSGRDMKKYDALLGRFMKNSDTQIASMVTGYQKREEYLDIQEGAY